MSENLYGAQLKSPIFDLWARSIPAYVPPEGPDRMHVYSGGTGTAPAFSKGNLVITPSVGLAVNIPFADIISAYVLGVTTARKKVVDITCATTCVADPNCYVQIRKYEPTDQFPVTEAYQAIHVSGLVDCTVTCETKIDALVAQINGDPTTIVVASKATTTKLRLTAKTAGVDFTVTAGGCFTTAPVTVQDACVGFGTCADFARLGANLNCGCDNSSSTAFKTVGIVYNVHIPTANHGLFAGVKGANNATVELRKIDWVLFETTANDSMYTATLTALGDASEKLNRVTSTTAVNACSSVSLTTSSSSTSS